MKLFSPARIHLGFLELDQALPRFFGSIGLTITNFQFEVQISNSNKFKVITEHQEFKKKQLISLISLKKF